MFSILSTVVVFIILSKQIRRQEQISRLVSVMIVTSIPISLYGIFQHFGMDPLFWHDAVVERVTSTMGNAVFLAAYLAMIIALTLARLLTSIKLTQQEAPCTISIQNAGLAISYLIVLIIQTACILFTGSRGPWIGLSISLFFFTVIIGAIKRRRLIVWVAISLAAGSIFFVLLLSQPHNRLTPLKKIACFNRLGSLMDAESGSGNVRRLVWKGCIDLLTSDVPLKYPGGIIDPFYHLRSSIGYGPETMSLVFNRFYSPALSQVEVNKSLPDRAHNAVFDLVITTGIIGFLAKMILFGVVFYYSFLWLGLLGTRKQCYLFIIMLLGSAVAGTMSFGLGLGREFVGMGFPVGVLTGIGAYLFIWFFQLRHKNTCKEKSPIFPHVLMAALLASVIGHFIEIHFGFPISVSRLYFWIFIGLMTAMYSINKDHDTAVLVVRESRGKNTMLYAVLPLVIIIITMGFIFTHNYQNSNSMFSVILSPFACKGANGHLSFSIAMVCIYSITIALGAGIMTADLHQYDAVCQDGWHWSTAGKIIFLVLAISLPVLFILAHLLAAIPTQTNSMELANHLVNIGSFYYFSLFSVCIIFAAILVPRGPVTSSIAGRSRYIFYLFLIVVAFYLIIQTQMSQVMADTYAEQAETCYKFRKWNDGISMYTRAIELSPQEDSYYRNLSAGLVEKAKMTSNAPQVTAADYHIDDLLAFTFAEIDRLGKFELLEYSFLAAGKAQNMNPLNVDNIAKLGEINRVWANFLSPEQRKEKLQRALNYYHQAVSLKPGDPLLWDECGRIDFLSKNYQDALSKFMHSLKIDSQVKQTFILLGDTYVRLKKLDEAITMYKKALSLDCTMVKPHLMLSYIYILQRRLHEALSENETVLSLQPDNYLSHKNLAIIYHSFKQYEKALKYGLAAMKLAPFAEKRSLQNFIVRLQRHLAEESCNN